MMNTVAADPVAQNAIFQRHFDAIASERPSVTPMTIKLFEVPSFSIGKKPVPLIADIVARPKNRPFISRIADSALDYLVGQPRWTCPVEGRVLYYPEDRYTEKPSVMLSVYAVEQGHFEALWNAGHELAAELSCDDVFLCNFNGNQQPTQQYIEQFRRNGKLEHYVAHKWRSKEYQRHFS